MTKLAGTLLALLLAAGPLPSLPTSLDAAAGSPAGQGVAASWIGAQPASIRCFFPPFPCRD